MNKTLMALFAAAGLCLAGASTAQTIAGAAETSSDLEYGLVGLAVLIALAGILLAIVRLKPAALPTKAQAEPERGFDRVLEQKYYVDEISV